ncbi:hypothetical protein M407DRAFT_244026, partial [Tulasnella calospora MUT 4182]
MTDPALSIERSAGANDVAPSVADIMVRTRHQLSIKREGKAKTVDSNDGLDEDAELSLRQPEYMYDGAQHPLDIERRRQLMVRLAEERKKFLQSDSSRPTNATSESDESPQPHNPLLDHGPNSQEQRLRAQARFRVRLALEKRKASIPATHPAPANSTPTSTSLSPIEMPPNPAILTSTPNSLLLEGGLKEKLKQRRAGASIVEDLKERLRARNKSL